MATPSDIEQNHSTLELSIHDHGENAPERNRETEAIELDSTAITPQVAFHTAPETRYSLCSPEVVDSLGCENREESASKSPYNRRLSKIMLFTILALFLAVAIGIGVGVGLTRSKADVKHSQEFPYDGTIRQELPYSGTILEGSSLAVLAPPNGPRSLFFQRRDGGIIQALFDASEWKTQVVVYDFMARNHTPISAIISSWDGSLYLFYIDELGHVTFKIFQINRRGWSYGYLRVDGKYDNFTITNANASSLSATSTLGPGNQTYISVLYENLNGDMIMLRQTPPNSEWRDISPDLYSAAPDALLRSPFSSGSILAGSSGIIATKPKIPSRQYISANEEECIISYQNETFKFQGTVPLGKDNLVPTASDGGAYMLSIDKPRGKISFSSIGWSPRWYYANLEGEFPFSKAAALFSDRNGTLIIYHQTINLSIAEQLWDLNFGRWINGTWIHYDKSTDNVS